jgi:exonuclease VII large subunit
MIPTKHIPFLFSIIFVSATVAVAQTSGNPVPADTPSEAVAKQIGMLRQSVQALDATLSDIADKFLPLYAKAREGSAESASRISSNFTLLTQAEQRAEVLRRQLVEWTEKEVTYRSRLTQIDEDMRPENIERTLNPYGTTRTAEMRDTRRRVLETERRGVDSLLAITTQNRTRLEDEVRQADLLVQKLRQRLNPLIEKEIDKLSPEP